MAISMLKIRRPLGRLIFNMGIAIPGKTVFLTETAPRSSQNSPVSPSGFVMPEALVSCMLVAKPWIIHHNVMCKLDNLDRQIKADYSIASHGTELNETPRP